MLVKEIMTKKVIAVKPNDSLKSVLEKFSKYNISGMPVVDKQNQVKGVVTESDILKIIDVCLPKIRFDNNSSFNLIVALIKKPDIALIKKHWKKIKVNDFMQKKIFTIKPDDSIIKAAELMNNKNVKRLAVVKDKKLVGIIARADIIKALAK